VESPRATRKRPTGSEEVARPAHQYWLERGSPIGTPSEDWFRAEEKFRLRRRQLEQERNHGMQGRERSGRRGRPRGSTPGIDQSSNNDVTRDGSSQIMRARPCRRPGGRHKLILEAAGDSVEPPHGPFEHPPDRSRCVVAVPWLGVGLHIAPVLRMPGERRTRQAMRRDSQRPP